MKILFFSHYFPPEGNAPASRTHENLKRWVKSGHQVTVVTCAPNSPSGILYPGYKNRLFQKETLDGIQVFRVFTLLAPNKGVFMRIGNYLSYLLSASICGLFCKRPDLIIATSPQFFCGWTGVIVSKLRRLPFVLEIRDIWPDSIEAVGAMSSRLAIGLLLWLEKTMYNSAIGIVTVGEGYREILIEKGVLPNKLTVIMNGVDRELFSPREADLDLADRYGLRDKFLCAYIGTIGMACGLDVVLRAGRLLMEKGREDIVFLLIGDGAYREDLELEAKGLGLSNVIFTGLQEKKMIPRFLSIIGACLVHLRNTELFTTVMPSKIFEAAGMKRPIIIGIPGFATAFVNKARAGIAIAPENEQELVAAVVKLADNPALRTELGQSGYDYVISHFDRDLLAENYLSYLKKILGGRN